MGIWNANMWVGRARRATSHWFGRKSLLSINTISIISYKRVKRKERRIRTWEEMAVKFSVE